MEYVLTRNAHAMIKTHMGLGKKAQERLLEKAITRGVAHGKTKGNLHKWVTGKLLNESHIGSKGVVYNNYLFIYTENKTQYRLITVLVVPSSMQKLVGK